jgi:hypothetical protein
MATSGPFLRYFDTSMAMGRSAFVSSIPGELGNLALLTIRLDAASNKSNAVQKRFSSRWIYLQVCGGVVFYLSALHRSSRSLNSSP